AGRLPDRIVCLHHTEGAVDRQAVECPAEAAERRLVVRARQQRNPLVMLPLRLGGEVKPRLVLEVDRVEALELDRARLGRLAGEPDGPLAPLRRIVDPADQVPREGPPVIRGPDSRGPLPGRVAGVVARRVVLDAETLDGAGPPADPRLPPDRHPGCLASPRVAALPAGA